MQDLYDPTAFASLRRSLGEARMLPPAAYVDPVFYAREAHAVFGRKWLFLDHEDRIARPGDYATLTLGGYDVLYARGHDGEVRAFANVCRHRGCRLVDGAGSARHFECRYHGWVYDLSGALRGAPQMHLTPGFERFRWGLVPIRLERWGGFLFVNFDHEAESLRDYLGPLVDRLAPYRFDDLALARRREIALPCNWKVYVENLAEPYHTPYVHARGMAGKNEDEGARMLSGNSRERFGDGGPDAPVRIEWGENFAALVTRHQGSRGVLPGENAFPPREGLAGDAAAGSIWAYVYPSTVISCQREAVWWNQVVPDGPSRSTLVIGSCFPRATAARSDFEAGAEAYYRRIDQTAAEDVAIVEQVQKGLSSPHALAGPLSHLEAICHAHRNWVVDAVLGEER